MDLYVVLVAADGSEFYLPRTAASHAGLLMQMMLLAEQQVSYTSHPASGIRQVKGSSSGKTTVGSSASSGVLRIPLRDISAPVLDMVCRYLSYKSRSGRPMADFPPFKQCDPENPAHRSLIVETLLAANYLDC
eukprot:ANDGO_07784.mRNA.1 hypothetical protein